MSEQETPEGTFEGATAEGSVPVTHANQLRSLKFKQLMRKRSTWAWLLGLSILAGGGLAAFGFPAAGGAAFVIVFLVVLLVVFMIADSRAADAFYDYYCSSHGLTRLGSTTIGSWTELLRKGDKSETNEQFQGELAPGLNGDLVLYTYTEVHRDSDGDETETDYPFTFIHIEMPEIVEHMTDLNVHQAGFRFLDKVQDKFLGDHMRVTLESDKLDQRYEIFVHKEQDQVWVRRLFSPSFIVWLSETPPKNFQFELEDGHLVAFVSKHMDDTEGFENVTRLGTYVATRLLEEVAQTSPKTQ